MNDMVRIDPVVLSSTLHKRPISIDISYTPSKGPKPLIIHVHGFKGFKDWGYFNQLAGYFAESGFIFIKLNFSHNGVTLQSPLEFTDLDAFGNNNFSIEQDDLAQVIDFIFSPDFPVPDVETDKNHIFLMGHSRGGAAVILKGYFDDRIRAVASWAGVNDLSNHFSNKEIEKWKEEGVTFVLNSRTGQNMPLYYQVVEDYLANESSFDLPAVIGKYTKPLLVIHGTMDETVPYQAALQTKAWYPGAELFLIEGADHVFGGGHPWTNSNLPDDAVKAADRTIRFLREVIKSLER